jgi:hypothetical protein
MYKISKKISLIILTFSLFSCTYENTKQKINPIVIAKQIPLEDFFKNPEKSSYQISPDGSFYSFMAPYKKKNEYIHSKNWRFFCHSINF